MYVCTACVFQLHYFTGLSAAGSNHTCCSSGTISSYHREKGTVDAEGCNKHLIVLAVVQ